MMMTDVWLRGLRQMDAEHDAALTALEPLGLVSQVLQRRVAQVRVDGGYDVLLKRYAWTQSMVVPYHRRRQAHAVLEGLGFDVWAPPWLWHPRNPPRRYLWAWWAGRQPDGPGLRKRFDRIGTPVLRRMWRTAEGVPAHTWEPVTLQCSAAMTIGIDTSEHLDHPVAYHNDAPTPGHRAVLPLLMVHAAQEAGIISAHVPGQ
jgi:hypothetical protein